MDCVLSDSSSLPMSTTRSVEQSPGSLYQSYHLVGYCIDIQCDNRRGDCVARTRHNGAAPYNAKTQSGYHVTVRMPLGRRRCCHHSIDDLPSGKCECCFEARPDAWVLAFNYVQPNFPMPRFIDNMSPVYQVIPGRL